MDNSKTVLFVQPAKPVNIHDIPTGLYRIKWTSGGDSIAAIGQTRNGGRWIAPCNWVEPEIEPDWTSIVSIELIEKNYYERWNFNT